MLNFNSERTDFFVLLFTIPQPLRFMIGILPTTEVYAVLRLLRQCRGHTIDGS